jgi:hypothetical protein
MKHQAKYFGVENYLVDKKLNLANRPSYNVDKNS